MPKVRRGSGGKNVVRGLSGGLIVEEETASFDAVTSPDMDVPKINPYEPGHYGSNTSSLNEE